MSGEAWEISVRVWCRHHVFDLATLGVAGTECALVPTASPVGIIRCSYRCETGVSWRGVSKTIHCFISGDTDMRRNPLQSKLESSVLQNTDFFSGIPCYDVLPWMRPRQRVKCTALPVAEQSNPEQ